MNRINSLDYLRGIMAFSIMLYQYSYLGEWNDLNPNYFINKIGLYGVTIFFILSGMSLALAYKDFNFLSSANIINYTYKRLTRILPLFWLILTFYLLYFLLTGTDFPSTSNILYSYTLLFGFIYPMPYFIMGGWSIGVEVVLYVFFPIILLILNFHKFKYLIYTILLFLFIFTTFYLLNPNIPLASQWPKYIIVFNHLFYFASGVILVQTKKYNTNTVYTFLIIASITIFYFYPVINDIDLVAGINKLFFTSTLLIFMYSIYHMQFNLPESIETVLLKNGDISYGLYLLHPICLKYVLFIASLFAINHKFFLYSLSAMLSIAGSLVIYYHFEKPISITLRNLRLRS